MDGYNNLRPRGVAAAIVLAAFFCAVTPWPVEVAAAGDGERFVLSPQHLSKIERRRRVVVNFDAIHGDLKFANIPPRTW